MEDKDKGGRPTKYTQELAERICQRLAAGTSLRNICKAEDMPSISTVCLWVIQNRREGEAAPFSEQYARARQAQAMQMADEIVDISDESVGHDMSGVMAYRLKVDTRKWYLSKVLPKVYGEKLTLAGDEESPLNISIAIKPEK